MPSSDSFLSLGISVVRLCGGQAEEVHCSTPGVCFPSFGKL